MQVSVQHSHATLGRRVAVSWYKNGRTRLGVPLRSSRRLVIRSGYNPEQERDIRPSVPSAPPPGFTPPPPPPSRPSRSLQGGFPRFNRRGIFAVMLGGAAVVNFVTKSTGPKLQTIPRGLMKDPDAGFVGYITTKGGSQVAVGYDEYGNMFMYDKAGNFYYDTGDEQLGWNMIEARWKGKAFDDADDGTESIVYNLSTDRDGKVVKTKLGKLGDLTEQQIEEIGGVPLDQLKRSVQLEGRRKGFNMEMGGDTVSAFRDEREIPYPGLEDADGDYAAVMSPEELVVNIARDKDGRVDAYPSGVRSKDVLEEGVILLEEKNRLRMPWLPEPSVIDSVADDKLRRGSK